MMFYSAFNAFIVKGVPRSLKLAAVFTFSGTLGIAQLSFKAFTDSGVMQLKSGAEDNLLYNLCI